MNPSTLSSSDLNKHMLHRRAVEAVIWGMPVVNYDLMLQEMLRKTAGKVNQVLCWGRQSAVRENLDSARRGTNRSRKS